MTNTYRVKEIVDTIQGEGVRAGTRAIFVRFAGCNMWNGKPEDRMKGVGACARWCDTDFMAEGSKTLTAEEIAQKCEALWPVSPSVTMKLGGSIPFWVVLTGGEPMLQIDETLLCTLVGYGFNVAVETNGTVYQPLEVRQMIDHLCVSPKLKADGSVPELKLVEADELKVVLPGSQHGLDGWTEEELLKLADEGNWAQKVVQPQDPIDPKAVEISHLRGGMTFSSYHPRQFDENLKRCIEWVKCYPDWRLGIQLHKLIGLP